MRGLMTLSVAALLVLAGPTHAGGRGTIRKQVESSLIVKGTIDLHADGRVAGYALEGSEKLPKGVLDMIAGTVPQFRFEPVALDPGTTRARAQMSLRLVARKLDDDQISVAIRGAQFGRSRRDEYPTMKGRPRPPQYPFPAVQAGLGGMVYVALKVGRDGRVLDAVTEQVNLHFIADETRMAQWRQVFAKASLNAARGYTFSPPSKGDEAAAPYWSVRVPFEFVPEGRQSADPSGWHTYVPGPRMDIPWIEGEEHESADAIAGSGIQPIGGGPRLLTRLESADG